MFNFKRNTKVYLVYGSSKYKLEVYPDLSVSQTYDEQSIDRKTLHNPLDLHKHATIIRASVANFSFTVPVFDNESSTQIQKELELATSYLTGNAPNFDLYFESDEITYKLEKAVFDRMTLNLSRDAVITASLSGNGSKLAEFIGEVPGTLVPAPTRDYCRVGTIDVDIGTQQMGSITNLVVEFANEIEWTKNDTIHATLEGDIQYQTSYVLKGRQVNGSISEYLTSDNQDQLYDTTTNTSVDITINGGFLRFYLPSTVFTRRTEFGDVFTRTYDYRLNTNSQTVKPIYKGV